MNEIGRQVKHIREKRGLGVAEFAAELGVSPGYLNQLETGKTRTLQLEVLSRLQQELYIDVQAEEDARNRLTRRLNRLTEALMELYDREPQAAEYLIGIVEQGLAWVGGAARQADGVSLADR
ncbi:helix-turn-helix domain-containing protein [Paenibacillus sp. P26]|nr:helix-turn-helix domain-containing protein [Paenibacillus sp. P26]UUZ95566.1 helix-turn-helix domain-containing protein [Paenibacillus sp. P25]